MIGVMSNPVKSMNSHNGGWTLVCKSLVEEILKQEVELLTEKDDWSGYDALVINEGINYKEGSYNFIGGVSESVKERLEMLLTFPGKIYSISKNVDYKLMCEKRKELTEYVGFKFPTIDFIDINSINSKKLILGDSHSVSVYQKGYKISRNDGKTLHGFLKVGLKNYIPDDIEELVFYAGNIDIRFHISRIGNNVQTMNELCLELERQLRELKQLKKISIVALLPIENESRKIPGTGKYKGQNFFGSQSDRMANVRIINSWLEQHCIENGWEFLKWPFNYDYELSFDYMEQKQSVHLRPTSYMFIDSLVKKETNTNINLTLF